jgi:hypothetical protein
MLIDEIIAGLSNERGSLSEALLRTKILLHQIGKKELAEWVNNELNGYPEDAEVPDYRVVPSRVLANCRGRGLQASSHPIPLAHLTSSQRNSLLKSKMREPLSALQRLADGGSEHLCRDIPMEANGYLSQGLTQGLTVDRAWCEINPLGVQAILVQVRSRLLDFILELKGNIGDLTSESAIKGKVASLDATGMFHNAIFGPNASIVVGNSNVQTTAIVAEGDFHALAAALMGAGIPSGEIEKLEQAIKEDRASGENLSLGGKIGGWLTDIIKRAAQGVLNASVD